jgi:hypothetical protein
MPSTIGLNGKWLMSAYHDLSSSIWQYLRARPEPPQAQRQREINVSFLNTQVSYPPNDLAK